MKIEKLQDEKTDLAKKVEMLTMQLQAKSEALVSIESQLAANTIIAGNASRSTSTVDNNNT